MLCVASATTPHCVAPLPVKEGRDSVVLRRNRGRLSIFAFLPLSGCERSAWAVVGLLMLFCSRRPALRRARAVEAERVRS
jgi:hypothetical protein